LGQTKWRRRRPRGTYVTQGVPLIYDPKDGLELNDIVEGQCISREVLKFNSHEHSQYIKLDHRYYKDISVLRTVMRVNRYKSFNINQKHVMLNRKANDGN